MTPNDDKISNIQVGVFVFNSILGVGVLSLPASMVKAAGTDAWVLTIISGFVNIFFIYIICRNGKRLGDTGFVDALKMLFGKFLGTILVIPVFIYFIAFSGLVVRIFAETLKVYLLINTPLEFIILPLLLLGIMLARGGVEPTARFFEAVTPIIIVTVVILIIMATPDKREVTNIRPFFTTPILDYIKGLKEGTFALSGFEILLVLFSFIRKREGVFKYSSISLLIIVAFYTIITVDCIMRFGADEMKTMIYPTMTLIKSIELPGAFLEGMEGILISLWVLFVFTTVTALIFSYSVIGGDLLKQRERKHIISLFLPVMYLVSLTGDNIVELFDLTDKLTLYLGGYTIIVVPVLMFIMISLKKIGKNKDNDSSKKGSVEDEV